MLSEPPLVYRHKTTFGDTSCTYSNSSLANVDHECEEQILRRDNKSRRMLIYELMLICDYYVLSH